jgi:PAS domain S-box-containing protein
MAQITPTKSNRLQTVKLQLKWKHQFQFAGYYAAIEKGYYKEAGLKVELIEPQGDEDPTHAVFAQKADFGISTSDIVLARSKGMPAVVLASIFQHSPQVIVASTKSKIGNVHDLVGKTVMIEPQAADIITYLNDEGLNMNRLKIVSHNYDINQLLTGEIDATSAYVTDEPFLLQKANFDYTIISPLSGGIDFYGDVLFTSEAMINNSPEVVEKFRKASLNGWKYAMDNPTEIIDLIYNKYSKRHDKAHLLYEANEMKRFIMPNVVEIGYSNPGRWEHIIATYQKLGLIKKDFDSTRMLYSYYQKPEMYFPWGVLVLIVSVMAILLFLVAFFSNLNGKLKKEIVMREKIQEELVAANQEIRNDIENRKVIEVKLRKLTVAVEQSPLTIVITDTNGKLDYTNPTFTKLTGYTYQEVKGKSSSILKSGKTEKGIFENLWKTILAGEIWQGEFINRKKNGDEFFEQATIAPVFNDTGDVISYIAIKEDITVRKKIEQALKESEERFKTLNDTKDKFFSIIAHDLRNLFNVLTGVSEILLINIDKYPKEKIKDMSQTVFDTSKETYTLLDNLLTWASLQTGGIETHFCETTPSKLIQTAIQLCYSQAETKHIRLESVVKYNESIQVDEQMINTVLRNLVTNAIKFTYPNGLVTVNAELYENKLLFTVTDTGTGIENKHIETIFRIDNKLSKRGTTDEQGTGLGLILCKEFVEKHNGTIWVESIVGKGSSFKFMLPIA